MVKACFLLCNINVNLLFPVGSHAEMALLPIELFRRILQLRTDVIFQICCRSWQEEWQQNVTNVNKEYCSKWTWYEDCLGPSTAFLRRYRSNPRGRILLYNKRDLRCRNEGYGCIETRYLFKMMKIHTDTNELRFANFTGRHYCYTFRSEIGDDHRDRIWFLKSLAARTFPK